MSTANATGPFDVTLGPEPLSERAQESGLGRMSLAKVFHGDLVAVSQGEMLAFRTDTAGSAGYVAMEKVVGSLHGLKGSFVLQHSSSMTRGVAQQSITVVPDSGTDQLRGLSGSLVIRIEEGRHSYQFDYLLPASDDPVTQTK
jgi:hypothetical protein